LSIKEDVSKLKKVYVKVNNYLVIEKIVNDFTFDKKLDITEYLLS
jgi:hypothetical protein